MYTLFQVFAEGAVELGKFNQFMRAVEHAETKPEIDDFKITDCDGRELVGARFSKGHGDSIYWRLKDRKIKRGRRDERFSLIALVI